MATQAPSNTHHNVPSPVDRGFESLIAEFDQIELEANSGAVPSSINLRLADWTRRAKEALQ